MDEKLETSDAAKIVITCEPNVGIANSITLFEHLKSALSEGREVEIHAADVEKVDTAILQVFLAFVLEAKSVELAVNWVSVSEPFLSAATLLGLKTELGLPEAA